jgi:hypothetical protein
MFALVLVILFIGAGVCAALDGKWNEVIYSFSAAALNFVVYFRPFH